MAIIVPGMKIVFQPKKFIKTPAIAGPDIEPRATIAPFNPRAFPLF